MPYSLISSSVHTQMAARRVSLGGGRQIAEIVDISMTVSIEYVCMVHLRILVLACCLANGLEGNSG